MFKSALKVIKKAYQKNPNQWEEIYNDLIFELEILDD